MIWKGDTISCTRDNENGQRKGPRDTTPTPPPEHCEAEPSTTRDPFPVVRTDLFALPIEASDVYVPRETFEEARRAIERLERQLAEARAEVSDARNVIVVMRKMVGAMSVTLDGAL